MKLRPVLAALLVFFGVFLAVFVGLSFLLNWRAGVSKIVDAPTIELAVAPSPTVTLTAARPLDTPTAPLTETFIPLALPSSTVAITRANTAAPTPSRTPTVSPTATLPLPTITPARTGQLSAPQRIVIEKINVDAKVVPMRWSAYVANGRWQSQWDVPKNDAGHIYDTPNPGERGNVVLAGHNNLYAAIFKKLYTLEPGDEIKIYNSARQGFVYRVVQSFIVAEEGQSLAKRLENARVMDPTQDARVTIISCWPEWSNEYRAIVIAKLVGAVN
ncbi:MAG: hypothetical protein B6D41_00325 [Chloroflexi bacterium UTCFX4]|jgi:sortase A|nr:MAG: hypothetical protein B6D41_00325 [Chloroflexi bacterium UTCFX4]